MRQVVLDTETTGLDPKAGHRVIEIGCLELINRQLTGRQFHVYLNPEREIDADAVKVHGITNAFLFDKPLFSSIKDDFLSFVTGAELIIHNAPFDMGFLRSELVKTGHKTQFDDYCTVLDTLVLAKQKHPGQKNNLDALCKRYGVNNSNRDLHGALLDAELLAYVYLAMTGGQLDMFRETDSSQILHRESYVSAQSHVTTRIIYATQEELNRHHAFWENV